MTQADARALAGIVLRTQLEKPLSHHGSERMSQQLRDIMGLGATGNYPNGKLDEHDEGEIKIAITADTANKIVSVDFGKSVTWIGFTPDQARELADMLTDKAFECRGIRQ